MVVMVDVVHVIVGGAAIAEGAKKCAFFSFIVVDGAAVVEEAHYGCQRVHSGPTFI
jgi:hypothetical protein